MKITLKPVSQQVMVITGASSGIGLATAEAAARAAAKLVLAARSRVLEAAATPTRARKVGLVTNVNVAAFKFTPSLADRMAARQAARQQYNEPPRDQDGALFKPSELTTVVGQTHGPGGRSEPAAAR